MSLTRPGSHGQRSRLAGQISNFWVPRLWTFRVGFIFILSIYINGFMFKYRFSNLIKTICCTQDPFSRSKDQSDRFIMFCFRSNPYLCYQIWIVSQIGPCHSSQAYSSFWNKIMFLNKTLFKKCYCYICVHNEYSLQNTVMLILKLGTTRTDTIISLPLKTVSYCHTPGVRRQG